MQRLPGIAKLEPVLVLVIAAHKHERHLNPVEFHSALSRCKLLRTPIWQQTCMMQKIPSEDDRVRFDFARQLDTAS